MTENQGFGGRLRKAREQAGLSQQELAGATKVHKQHISKLERGALERCGQNVMKRLTEALGVTEAWLVHGIVAPDPQGDHADVVREYLASEWGLDTPPEVAARLFALDWRQVAKTTPTVKDVHRMREMIVLNLRLG